MTTDTPIADQAAAAASSQQPPAPHRRSTFMSHLHGIGRAVAHVVPLLESAATNPQVDEAIELLMQVLGLGPEEAELNAVLVLLRDIVDRKQQPPAPIAATGPQPVIGATVTDAGTAIQPTAASVFTPAS